MNHELWTMYHETRLTQPKRAAQPSNEIQPTKYYVRNYKRNMQNKPNVKYAQINVNSYLKSNYEKLDTWLSGKNKPNSNPIQTQSQKSQNERKLICYRGLQKKR